MRARVLFLACCLTALVASRPAPCAPQEESQDGDRFFAGTVTEASGEQLTVARVLVGRTQTRTFRITPETKVEGRLAAGVRVTVRWTTGEDADLATLVIVRPEPARKGKR
jgi:hypothetical protein